MVYLFLADGFEIIEAMDPLDMLTRAGVEVKTVGVTGDYVTASCGVAVKADISVSEVSYDDIEAVILPGGMPGTVNLENSEAVQDAVDNANVQGAYVCAICAAPSILGHKGILSGKEATAFPVFENDLEGATLSDSYVVTDGNIITARGAGVATEFGLEIVKALVSEEESERVRKTIQCQ